MALTVKIRRMPGRSATTLVDALISAGRNDEASAHCRRALAEQPENPTLLRDAADVLLVQGRYREALDFYRRAAARAPGDQEIHELLAAVHWKLDEAAAARGVLADFFRAHPIQDWDRGRDDSPAILRLSGLDATICRLDERTKHRPATHYRGGYFLTTHLLPRGRYRVQNWTIAQDNINSRADVPAHDLLLNTIADADAESRSLLALSAYMKARPTMPIVNHPDRVLTTTRDQNARRLNAIEGVLFPRTERFRPDGAGPEAAAARVRALGLAYPLIVRETGTHTGRTVALVESEAKLVRYFANAAKKGGDEFYLIEFIDERFVGPDGKSYFNKKRVFCIDGRLYPVVSHVDRVWNVHGHNRLAVMKKNPWMQAQEEQYLADPAKSIGGKTYRILEDLGASVGLDFCGVDYAVRRDGTLLVFEMNAAMRHSHDHARNFPYMRPFMESISEAFAVMLTRKLAAARSQNTG
ncbi:MAG: tetratricopeptide repeat protein [Alphaproteobacteria bacterium]|nr:tetratricopeptide repeat protein [Alphaproteobacteria bacterium]